MRQYCIYVNGGINKPIALVSVNKFRILNVFERNITTRVENKLEKEPPLGRELIQKFNFYFSFIIFSISGYI